jgi:hypothetical protein
VAIETGPSPPSSPSPAVRPSQDRVLPSLPLALRWCGLLRPAPSLPSSPSPAAAHAAESALCLSDGGLRGRIRSLPLRWSCCAGRAGHAQAPRRVHGQHARRGGGGRWRLPCSQPCSLHPLLS